MNRKMNLRQRSRKLPAGLAMALLLLLGAPSRVVLAGPMAVVPAEEAGKEAYVVNKGIKWYTSLEDAQAEARKEGKLVFWMHMLGTMDGAT